MKTFNLIAAFVVACLIAGCGDSVAPQSGEGEAPVEARDTRLSDAVNDSLDKAKAVEDVASERKAEMDARLEQLESAGGKDDTP